MNIDWKSVPEATHFNTKSGIFYKVSDGRLLMWWYGCWITSPYNSIQELESVGGNMVEKPAVLFVRVKNPAEFRAAKKLLADHGYHNYAAANRNGCILYSTGGWDRLDANPQTEYPEEHFKEIFLSDKEKHIHYDLIVQWASDPSQKVWFKCNGLSKWCPQLCTPSWELEYEYHIGEAPPKETIMIGGEVVAKPVSEVLLIGQKYYVPSLAKQSFIQIYEWAGEDTDHNNLKHGLIHLAPEDAIQHAKALIKISGGKVD